MAYSTVEDILHMMEENDIGQLASDERYTDSVQLDGSTANNRIERAIEDAGAEIDGYLGSRYPVPLAVTPGIIRKLSVDIAIYNLYSRRKGPPENWVKRYNNAIDYLKSVAKGEISLGGDDPNGNPPETDHAEFHSDNPGRLFTRGRMNHY